MATVRRLLSSWWIVSLAAAGLVALVLAFGAPLFAAAFRPTWMRALCVLLVAAGWGVAAALRHLRARRAADAIAAELVQPGAADAESRAMSEALATLRSAAGKRRDYLYAKPWYVIIGPPGAGKTTALLHSGLHFSDQQQSLKGVGGTRNLDFWFADEAAMVDTAGRYTTQDSDREADARGWTTFLTLLRKHRPRQPINGVIVAIGIDELLRADRAGLDAHARAVRRRLAELRETLRVTAPVYVLLTKADLLAGFTDYYDDLDVEGRRAVLGATLPWDAGVPDAATLARAFDGVAQAVADRQAKRLSEEPDATRRSTTLGFPAQLQSLRARLLRFLDGAFVAGDEPGGRLRGFYLTSGVQEGTPIDRILAGMGDLQEQPRAGSRSGRAYFLNRLLTEVMFPEAGLVALDPRADARRRTRLAGATAAIAAACLLAFVAWGVSYARNRGVQRDLLAGADRARTALREAGIDLHEVRASDPDLRAALPALEALRTLPRGYAERQAGGAPTGLTFGLYRSSLSAEADGSYREALRRVLLPRLLLRLEDVMKADAGNPSALYEPLKIYLMLGGQGPMDKAAVRSFVTGDWAANTYAGPAGQPQRAQLERHLAALLDDPDLAGVWPGRRPPLDGALVAQARGAVRTLAPADRAYAILKAKAAAAGPAWELAGVLNTADAAAFANPQGVRGLRVPFLYTRAGFDGGYTPGLASLRDDLKKDAWVLGDSGGPGGGAGDPRPGIAALYTRDYVAAWEGILQALQPADYASQPAAFASLTRTPSPLKRVLGELRANTSLAGSAEGAAIQAHFAALRDFAGTGQGAAPVDAFTAGLRAAGPTALAAAAPPQFQPFAAAAGKVGGATQTAGDSPPPSPAATGGVADAYTHAVLPACRGVAQDHYPFFGGAAQDASVADAGRLFGKGGTLDVFAQQRLTPLVDIAGPVWRWKSGDPATASLDPQSPEQFAKAAEIRELLAGGLSLKISVAAFGSDVSAVEFASGGARYRFTKGGAEVKPLRWSADGPPSADVVLYGGGQAEVARFATAGPWALFRLMDRAGKENAGAQTFRATFGEGARSATFLIQLPTERNPFSRGGLWSFRCPVAL